MFVWAETGPLSGALRLHPSEVSMQRSHDLSPPPPRNTQGEDFPLTHPCSGTFESRSSFFSGSPLATSSAGDGSAHGAQTPLDKGCATLADIDFPRNGLLKRLDAVEEDVRINRTLRVWAAVDVTPEGRPSRERTA